MEGYLAEIRYFAADFAPKAWALCQGQILPIATNQALFSLLGTTYGGNGVTTFALPDFRSRIPVGTGQMVGGQNYTLGEISGVETVTLVMTQMPVHTHTLTNTFAATATPHAVDGTGDQESPTGNYFAASSAIFNSNATSGVNGGASPVTISGGVTMQTTGGNQPHSNIMPYTCINVIICLQGIFPSRN